MASMYFVDCNAAGSAEQLFINCSQVPAPAVGEVLIKVRAAGVNRPDILQRQGFYPPPLGASSILGLEVSGQVIALGAGVNDWRIGDSVCALVNGGGYAEYVLAPAAQCLPIPKGVSLADAAGLPETCFTVWHNLFQRARLVAGESLLVHGGGSGIGTTAIQIATTLGVRVFTTASSAYKCQVCTSLGAFAINYHQEDFVEVIKRETEGRGVDVILDMVGGDYIQRNLSVAAKDGRIVNIAFLRGSKVNLDLMSVMLKRLTLTGSTLRAQTSEVKAAIARELREQLWPHIEAGKIRPIISARFPFKQVADAHRLMESGAHIGKILLEFSDDN